ncbi:hypothetical protein CYMTET_15143 [Cymbomonas tetramitiformis]|uniref:Uncharacterized protein n=1 Tax=Cymbomonas tetramitiformis TaxID=36881 RepID=A0AAE0GG30_9CHLO|nr:hypothetical protein CYMTET_15143 [Cymbomonas tetramitiformis]
MQGRGDRVRATNRVPLRARDAVGIRSWNRGVFSSVSNLDWVLQSIRAAIDTTDGATSLIPSRIASSSTRDHTLSVHRDRGGTVRRLHLGIKLQTKEVQLDALHGGNIVLTVPGQNARALPSDAARVRYFLHVVTALLASSSSNVGRSVAAGRPSAATLRRIAHAVRSDPPTFFLYRATNDFAILTTTTTKVSNRRYDVALQRLEDSNQFCEHCLDTPTLARFDSRALEFFYHERQRNFDDTGPSAESAGLYRAFGVRAHPFVTPEYEFASRDGEFVCLDVVSRMGVFCHASLDCESADGSDAVDDDVDEPAEPSTERALLKTLASHIRRHFMLLGSGDLCDQTRGILSWLFTAMATDFVMDGVPLFVFDREDVLRRVLCLLFDTDVPPPIAELNQNGDALRNADSGAATVLWHVGSPTLKLRERTGKWAAPSATRVCRVTAVPAAATACCDAESASSARKRVLRCAGAYLCRRLRSHATTTTRFDDNTSNDAPLYFGDWSDMMRALLFEASPRSATDDADGEADTRLRLGELLYGAIGLNNDADLDEFRTACATCATSDERSSSREMECRRCLYREFAPLLWSPLPKLRTTMSPAEASPLNLYRVRHRRDGDLLVNLEDLRVEVVARANGERFRITAARIVTADDGDADDGDGRRSSGA